MTATNSIAIFGGTFDPIHNGHVHVISEILKSGKFSKLVIVPAGKPWQKSPSASANNRLEMTKLALSDIDVEVSDCEVKRDTPSIFIAMLSSVISNGITGILSGWIDCRIVFMEFPSYLGMA